MRLALGVMSGLFAAVCGLQASAQVPQGETRDVWFEIVSPAGEVIGWQHEYRRPAASGSEIGRVRELAYRIDDHVPTRSTARLVRQYDSNGKLRGFTAELLTRRGRQQTVGRVDAGTMLMEASGGAARPRSLPWAESAVLVDPLALAEPGESGWDIAPGAVTPLAVNAETAAAPSADGAGRELRLLWGGGRLVQAGLIVRDAAGAISGGVLPMLGHDFTLRRVAGPLGTAALSTLRQVPHEMRQSPFFVGGGALQGRIRYRFGWRFGFDHALPQTGDQSAVQREDGWQVDVCALCGQAAPTPPAELARFRQPSPWIESSAAEFRRAVRSIRAGNDHARMLELGQIARRRLAEVNFEGHVSARAAWRRRSGDCTEDAVVLAALARAAGIPARVANGLVYSRQRYHGAVNAFLPHSWVLAWVDGRWRSYDIALQGFDASHIALSIGDGEPAAINEANRLAALLEWQGMAEVRKKP